MEEYVQSSVNRSKADRLYDFIQEDSLFAEQGDMTSLEVRAKAKGNYTPVIGPVKPQCGTLRDNNWPKSE